MHLILQAWIIRKMKVIVKVKFGLDQLQLNEFLGRKSAASFFFTEAEGRALLGLPKARDLNLIIFHCSVQSDSANPFDTHELPTPSQAKPEGVTLKPVTSSKRTGGTPEATTSSRTKPERATPKPATPSQLGTSRKPTPLNKKVTLIVSVKMKNRCVSTSNCTNPATRTTELTG